MITLRASYSGAVYCNRSCLCVCVFVAGGRAVSEPYYSELTEIAGQDNDGQPNLQGLTL